MNNIEKEEELAINKYREILNEYKENSIKDFKDYVNNSTKKNLDIYKKKYPHIKKKIGKNTKLKTILQSHVNIYEFIQFINKNESINANFSDDEMKLIFTYHINKIQGIYKHAQALKTGYCNLKIMNALSKDELTFAIAKNTLEAGGQWQERIFKDINHRWPQENIRDKIMVISSKKKEINKQLLYNATHCKNINEAWKLLSDNNEFNVIFVCSNKTRINDIYELTNLLQNLKPELQKKINIIHDEAHNTKEGIPPFRNTIENIILQSIVNIYIPCTASKGKIIKEDNPLWVDDNLENKALDYTDYDITISTDPQYSSVSDNKKYTFEDLSKKKEWINDTPTEVPIEDFIKC